MTAKVCGKGLSEEAVASKLRTTSLQDAVAEAGPALYFVCGAASEELFGRRVTAVQVSQAEKGTGLSW